ncbi:MAG: SdpI family protein [Syntrophobacteraceae bacterium]|nr:SdpI family protein [Syntrophobacteraceae bacterium]
MTNQPFFIPALIIAVAAIPLVLGVIPRNGAYGIRTKKTLSEDRIWYKANRFGGWMFIFSSLVYLMTAKFDPTSGPRDPDLSLWLLHLTAFALPLPASVWATLRHIRNL